MKSLLEFVGLGLFDEKDITLRGLEEARKADHVFLELYTSKWHGSIKNLERMVGKEIKVLSREDLEEKSSRILELAKNQRVLVFVQGDALVQTTHIALIQEAKKLGIETKVVHNASIISAVAETGLHPQKFGPYVTIPFLEKTKGSLPESVYEVIKMNKARGLHTLCLLDVTEEKCMSVKEALRILLDLEAKRKEGIITPKTNIIVFARAGSENPLIIYGKIDEIFKKNIEEIPAVLIIPGLLHFTEKEYLSLLYSE